MTQIVRFMLLLLACSTALSARVPVVPVLTFSNAAGQSMVAPHDATDLNQAQHIPFRNFIRYATKACFVGVWRMYPLPNYDIDLPNGNWGPTFRGNMESQCVDLIPDEHGVVFFNQRSIRALDPQPASWGLSIRAISLYPKEYAAGTPQVIFFDPTFPDVVVTGAVKSLLMTSLYHTTPIENTDPQWFTLFEVSVGLDTTSRGVCLYLSELDASGIPSKIYYSGILDSFSQVVFGSVKTQPAPLNTATECALGGLQLPPLVLPPANLNDGSNNGTDANNPVFGTQ